MGVTCTTDNFSVDRLSRRKVVAVTESALPRVLTLLDLTALGIGSTIGVGFYVLAGEAARTKAGPAVTVSFLIAAVASFFSGLCYAEFGGRVPKAGSAYIYTYVCIGEFIAFIIGWNLILEYLIGTASVASGFSGYIDAFVNNSISSALTQAMPMDVPGLGPYPDLLAAGLCLTLAAVLAFGVKESSVANNVVTIINLFVVVYVIISAATRADTANWHLTPSDLNETCPAVEEGGQSWGTGGFAPYGFEGIMAGAATCFYGFVGFDVIASTGEEALRPERNLPLAICLSLFVIFLSYFGMSTVLTLALPYCQQDITAPLIYLYDYLDMDTSKWIVSVGSIFGFSASLFGAIFPMPRVIYAMSSDGLLFRPLSKVNMRFRSPLRATMLSGVCAAVMAMLFQVDVLVNMMSIGTLQAYTIVALCVMMLRYETDDVIKRQCTDDYTTLLRYSTDPERASLTKPSSIATPDSSSAPQFSLSCYLRQAVTRAGHRRPTELSASFVSWATLIFALSSLILSVLLVTLPDYLKEGNVGAILSIVVVAVWCIAIVASIAIQPQSSVVTAFQVPLVPWLPSMSCFINLYLMCNLPPNTWYKFIVWMALGLGVFFSYSQHHSSVAYTERGLPAPDLNEEMVAINSGRRVDSFARLWQEEQDDEEEEEHFSFKKLEEDGECL